MSTAHAVRASLRPIVIVAAVSCLFTVPRANAQYMFLDSNGDGLNSAADVLPTSGTATVDVWLSTNQNRDGSVVICPTETKPMDFASYEFCLRAIDGRVAFSGFVNHSDISVTLYADGSTSEFYAAQLGTEFVPEGRYRLASVSVSVTSGAPSLQIVPDAPTLDRAAPSPPETAFGSECPGLDFDNTLLLGRDWFDVDGLSSGAPLPAEAPVLAPLTDMSVGVGELAVQGLRATDSDNDPVTFSLATGPGFVDVTTEDPGRGVALGTLHAGPHRDDMGSHAVTVAASDGVLSSTSSIQVRVADASNHPPLFSIPDHVAVVAGTRWTRTVVVRDFDGQALTLRKASGPDFLSASIAGQGEGGAVGSVRIGPSLCDAGEYDGVITASDGIASVSRPIHVSVRPAMPAPPTDLTQLVTARYPEGLAMGDLNGDGLMDVVATNELQTLSVFIAQGGGAFAPQHAYAVAGYPSRVSSVTLADFNEDGHLDAAVGIMLGDDNVTVLFGSASGSFLSGYAIPGPAWPEAILSADINDDGHADILVASAGSSSLSVLLGRGDGTFEPRRDTRVAGAPYGLTVGDWNRDGRLDVAVAGAFYSTVSILLGHGDGTFREPTSLDAGRAPFDLVTGDWDRDGSLDLAAVDYNGSLLIYRGDGAGGFTRTAEFDGFSAAQSVTVGDLNGDGIDDLVVGDVLGQAAQVFHGDGEGGFVEAEKIALPGGAYQCAIGDVDGDAVPDLAMSDPRYGAVLVRRYAPAADAAAFARAFVIGDHRPVIYASRTPSFCVRLEPVDSSFTVEDVDLTSLRLASDGTGSVDVISADASKENLVGDRDHNGVDEIAVCFAGTDLAQLFSLVTGRQEVGTRLEGSLRNGRFFCTRLTLDVQGSNQPLAASVAPNPLNPSGVLRFTTSRRGPLTVTLFDIQGRRVRILADAPDVPAGEQRLVIDGRNDSGGSLASGIYFYRIDAAEGSTRGRFSILK